MTCQQVQRLLHQLTWPQVQAAQRATLQQHVEHCPTCQPLWQQWQHEERALTDLLAVTTAPPRLAETVMSHLRASTGTAPTTVPGPTWTLNASVRGLQRLALHALDATAELPGQAHTGPTALLAQAHTQLSEYLRGERVVFQVPVDLQDCTPFVRDVLEATARIPYGTVRSYKWLAAQLGRPQAARAVGNALHANPVPVIIPCHRIVKSDGALGGYAFGLSWKTHLLALERATVPWVGCSTTRILCYRGCAHERRVQEGNRVHFASVQEALAVGYRPCAVCTPDV